MAERIIPLSERKDRDDNKQAQQIHCHSLNQLNDVFTSFMHISTFHVSPVVTDDEYKQPIAIHYAADTVTATGVAVTFSPAGRGT